MEKKRIAEINQKIKEKNKLRVDSGSPVKHKYGWGADQKRLDMKPQSKDSGVKWQKKESPKRREELGLGYLNKLDENSIKKVKEGKNKFIINFIRFLETKDRFENVLKQSEEKYKTSS